MSGRRAICSVLALAAVVAAGLASANELGDPDKGAEVFKKCKSCHQIGEGAKNRVGPQLNGIFGRPAGSLDGANYSKSMLRAGDDGLIWTEKTLDAYIENPKALISKTRMSFRGISDINERSHLLAYLRVFSDDPANIPEAEPTATATDHDLDPAILALKGDPEYGEYLASECLTCHQISGNGDGIPAITGWPTEDFAVAMHAYKRKLRPHPVMQMMAGRLSDEEIAAIAAYFKDLE
ncbi:c-type cytochrome [Sulfitobacter geojensis]|uniref:c-type cytochrome n=1 Tax=Sulfitobacter geojensis TaxID=1342299 RepID=UPI00248FFC2B|nr:c-type cytochrome [Sulfitobacter geojensis]